MGNYEFSLANHDDIPAIIGIYHSLIGTPGCAWNLDYPDIETAESDINNKGLYVLKSAGEIIAVTSISEPDELAHLSWKPENPCELARIGVIPAMHNQGIGSIILQKVINAAKNKNFDGIIMLVSKNNPAALALYNKHGFEKCGETSMFNIDFYCYEMVFEGSFIGGAQNNNI